MTQEALRMALEALEFDSFYGTKKQEAITAIKEALAQPEQEPVAHLWECLGRWSAYLVNNGKQADCAPPQWLCDAVKNATTPPQRTWVGLTDEDISEIVRGTHNTGSFVQAISAKLKEKNT